MARGAGYGLELPVARALGRFPWDDTGESAPSAVSGVELLVQLLVRLQIDGERTDPDVLVHSLSARSGRGAGVGPDALDTAGGLEPVRLLIAGRGNPADVRAAAVRSYARLSRPGGARWLIRTLQGEELPLALGTAQLTALQELATRGFLDLEAGEGRDLHDALLRAARGEVDLARRALELFADPAIVAVLPEDFDKAFAIELLRDELLAGPAMALLGQSEDPTLLRTLLDHAVFDEVAGGDVEELADFVELLQGLAGGDPGLIYDGAERLVVAGLDGSRNARRIWGLRMVAALEAEAVAGLTSSQHLEVVRWALELRRSGVELFQAPLPEDSSLLQRLIEVHLAGCEEQDGFGAGAREHARGLFLRDLLAAGGEESLEADVRAAFGAALASLADGSDLSFADRVLRDRARFLAERGAADEARADYSRLLFKEQEGGESRLAPNFALEPSDLRVAAQLLAQDADTESARLAFDVLDHLVQGPSWPLEPVALRMADLEGLLDHARSAADPARLERYLHLLDELPALAGEDVEGGPPSIGEPGPGQPAELGDAALGEAAMRPNSGAGQPVWSGLAANPELRERLWELHALAEVQLSELTAPVEPPIEPEPTQPEPEESEPEESEPEELEPEEPAVPAEPGAGASEDEELPATTDGA